jgi:hypothetical protein
MGLRRREEEERPARPSRTQLRERESGFRYTPTTTFETFPFPDPPSEQRAAVEDATRNLVDLRDGWLKARPNRTLTALYNEQPTWLKHAHRTLERAVIQAYGWPDGLSEEEILHGLLDLNQQRAAAEAGKEGLEGSHLPGSALD